MNSFRERFRESVRLSGKQLIDISNELGVSKQKLSHWQTGYCEPSIDDLILLAKYFGETVDYLVGNEHGENKSNAP